MQNVPNSMAGKLNILNSVFKRKKLLLGVVVVAAAAALVWYFFWGGAKKATASYLTDTVKRSTITSTISASGMIEPVSTVALSFKNSEIIKQIYVKAGDRVTSGQLLAEQDSENLEAQLNQASASLKGASSKLELLQNGPRQEDIRQAEANVTMAQGSYDLAKSSLERSQSLFQDGAISRADFDKVNLDFVNAEGKLKQAEQALQSLRSGNRPEDINSAVAQVESSSAQLQMAQNDLLGSKMNSPINGIVSAVNGAVGQRATANNNNTSGGSGFITVISEVLQVRAQVNEADIGKAAVGQKVEFTVNTFPDKTFTGKVGSISPQAYTVANVQIYDIVIQPDENFKDLKAGMPSNVNIIVDRRENALTLPKGATSYAVTYLNKAKQAGSQRPEGAGDRANPIESGQQQAVVLVMDQTGNPASRRVVLGLSDLRSFEVVKGLNEGDTVVIGAQNQPTATGGTPSVQGVMRGAGSGGGR